jgi:uncharacterized protein YabE (DUF348 family)
MHNRLFNYRHTLSFTAVAVCLLLISGFLLATVLVRPTHANNQRVVTIYDGDHTTTVTTTATTVADVLKRASIAIDDKDVVEPNKETILSAPSYAVNVYRARPITVVDGTQQRVIMSAYQSPRTVVSQAGIQLFQEDEVTLSRPKDISVSVNAVITINRSTALTLNLYGKDTLIHTRATTVKQLLQEKKIVLGTQDQLAINANTPITAAMRVEIWRNGVQTVTQEEPVAYETNKIQSADQPIGYSQVQTPGVNGKKSVTYQVEMRNGIEISRSVIQSVVTLQPVKQVEVVGTAPPPGSHQDWMAAAGISASDYGYVSYIVEHEGGWCAVRWQGDRGCIDHGSAPSGSGYGLVQATPGGKMASAGSDWLTNPITQLRWASGYAVGRYGSWQAAYNHWVAVHNW